MFTRTSRYASVADAIYKDPSGRQITYKLLRITPVTTPMTTHAVAQGDRLDLLSYQYYGDPEQFWRICDANNAQRPDNLTAEAGTQLIIPVVQS
jgi:hypothetical protein